MESNFKEVLPHLYLRIKGFENFCWIGEIHNPLLGFNKNFKGLLNLIEIILEYLDNHNIALAPSQLRSWTGKNGNAANTTKSILADRVHNKYIQEEVKRIMEIKIENYQEKLGSTDFLIKICFRQHTTWQGEIQWIISESKESKTIFFRSLLEMIFLIQEALDEDNNVKANYKFHSWSDDETELNSFGEDVEEDS
ncbi:MAG: hypothetical protein ACOCUD_04335 [Bacillota bacterium]